MEDAVVEQPAAARIQGVPRRLDPAVVEEKPLIQREAAGFALFDGKRADVDDIAENDAVAVNRDGSQVEGRLGARPTARSGRS